MSTTRRRLSEHEREQRRASDRERMQQAAEQLLGSEGWRRWVRVRSANGLSRYSLNNQLLIALQTGGTASFVAGFRAWLELGYAVHKGERAIRVLAPMTLNGRAEDSPTVQPHAPRDEERRRVQFRAVAVFDRRQVSPIEGVAQAPLEPPRDPLTGDSHAHLLERLQAFAATIGFTAAFEAVPGSAGGWCDARAKRIVVDAGLPVNAQVRVLVHELAHALGVGYEQFGRERAEVIVDTVTFIVCGSVGLDVGGESIAYVAGWGEHGALEAVTAFAETIDGLARRLEDALADAPADDEAAA
jgi:hypothetical protein